MKNSTKEDIVAALKERYKTTNGATFSLELNQKLSSLAITETGKEITWNEYIAQFKNSGINAKIPDVCFEAPETFIVQTSYTLDCTTTSYTIRGKYRILVDATIVDQNPINNALKTAGRINYYNMNGTLMSTSGYIYKVEASDIVYIRETINSNYEPVNEYEVTFKATGIDPNLVKNAGYMMLGLRYYTSCGGQAFAASLSPAMFTWNANADPCMRNDRVWINPPSPSNYGAIAGTNVVGYCVIFPEAWVSPHAHSVAIFDITNGANTQLTGSPFRVYNWDTRTITGMQLGKKYRIEYRNIMLTNQFDLNGATSCQTSNPTVEIWQF